MTDVYTIVADKILAELEKGRVPWRKPWVGNANRPCNLHSGRPYNGINALLLSMSQYSNPYWVTYKQAKELGGHVKKGEESTLEIGRASCRERV